MDRETDAVDRETDAANRVPDAADRETDEADCSTDVVDRATDAVHRATEAMIIVGGAVDPLTDAVDRLRRSPPKADFELVFSGIVLPRTSVRGAQTSVLQFDHVHDTATSPIPSSPSSCVSPTRTVPVLPHSSIT